MRCGGDGLKHRSCQREQYHGAAWYGSTILSHNHDAVYHGAVWYGSTIPSHDHDTIDHGDAWYGSTIPSRNHDAVWAAVLSGDASGGDCLKLCLKPGRSGRT